MVKTSATELHILKAAMDVFIEKGRHGARMQEIADRAGINKALLHYYFRNKENLYRRIFEDIFFGNISALISILNKELSIKEYLRTFISEYIEMLRRNPRLPMFIISEFREGGETVKAVLAKLVASEEMTLASYISVITRAIRQGEMKPLDPLQLISTIIGSCLFFFVAEPMLHNLFQLDDDFDRETFIEERKEAIFNTIAYGVLPGGKE